jgi:hypothetical protein
MLIAGYEKVRAHRSWIVKNLSVWGLSRWGTIEFAAVDLIGTGKAVYYGTGDIGESVQRIHYADLVDYRGNSLPAVINAPVVMIKPRSRFGAYLIGDEGAADFVIARDEEASEAVTVDLYIVEMGV